MRNGDDYLFGRDRLARAKDDPNGAIPFHHETIDAGLQADARAARCQPACQSCAIKRVERDSRDLDLPAVAVGKKAVDKNFARAGDVDAIERLAQGTYKHGGPEAFDRGLRLPMSFKPGREIIVRVGLASSR